MINRITFTIVIKLSISKLSLIYSVVPHNDIYRVLAVAAEVMDEDR